MTQTQKLSTEEIESRLAELPEWRVNSRGCLEREFEFNSFPEAFSFMTRVAFEAERMDHHPDWSNSYNKVKVELTTHSSGGVTQKDLELAKEMEHVNWS